MKDIFVSYLLEISLQSSFAQNIEIKGTIIDESNEPVSYCNVTFKMLNDSSSVTG